MKKVTDITYFNNQKLDFYLPENEGFKTIIYFHGGGMVEGNKWDAWTLGEHFSSKGICLVSVEYSLYPNAKFPQYLIEAAHAVKYVFDHIKEYGGSTNDIYISGQSAGAWLTLMLCFNDEYLKSAGVDKSMIKGWISDSAQPTSHFNVMKYEKGIDPSLQRIDEFAPLYYVNKDTKFSNLLLLYYENDMPCRLEQNQLLFKTLKQLVPTQRVEAKLCPGSHCAGSSILVDGEYPYLNIVLDYIKRIEESKKINVLMIGNSFSVDVGEFTHDLSLGTKKEIELGVLYIGGCNLEHHVDCMNRNAKEYEWFINGVSSGQFISLEDALKDRNWDYISLQQVSGLGGLKETYYPYIHQLIDYIKKYQKDTEIILHETWAYPHYSDHPDFVHYGNNTKTMHLALKKTYTEIAKELGIKIIIPSGDIIESAREKFNICLNRDGFHLNETGRYLASLGFVYTLCGEINELYMPLEKGLGKEDCIKFKEFVRENIKQA